MDQRMKQALKNVFYAPNPTRKTAFFKKYHRRELNCWGFLTTQAEYIHWWIWVASVLLFGAILWLASGQDNETIWMAAALTPFFALLIVVENGKSRFYGMEEIELSCRIFLRTVVLARMIILGLFHFLLLGVLIPVMAAWGTVGLFRAGLYLLTPYLLTAAFEMELTRHIRNRDGLLICGAVAAAISVLGSLAANIRPVLYQPEHLIWWKAALVAAIIAAVAEFMLSVKNSEELQWT